MRNELEEFNTSDHSLQFLTISVESININKIMNSFI